jgi:type VI secretion system secreted protein VgrG
MPTDPTLAVSTPLGDGAFTLTGFSGREELSRPFAFQLDLVAADATTVAPADLVGQPVGWTVEWPNTVKRQFHGVVRRLTAGPFIGRERRQYTADVVPWLWFLTRTADCKIFQNKSTPDILEAVFQSFGFTGQAYKLVLAGSYQPREYCVQYRETAFAFVSRLMEEEGIYYYFTYADGKHTLTMADDTSGYVACDPHAEVEYRTDVPKGEVVSAWDRAVAFDTGKYAHTDYDFENPPTSLLADTPTVSPVADMKKYEVFDYPGGHREADPGKARAKVRMQEVEAGYDVVTGAGRCNSFAPGGTFKLTNHVSDDGQQFVITAVEHAGTEPLSAGVRGGTGNYQNTFTAIPAAVPFRPARLTPRPVVEGPQTAVIVGPSGEEIHTDKYGRVKVHFHWDRYGKKDETDTCFIRVGELWAGKNWGMIFTPRIGQEVIVDFLEGDPDRPIITGRVYNAQQMPPYALPANMTQSGVKSRSTKEGGTDDFNELRFEDKKGNEDVYFHAQKDFHRVVENDDDLQVGHDQTIAVKNDRTEVVQEGNEKITIEKGNRDRTVSKGDDTLLVSEGKRTVTVSKGDETLLVDGGNRFVTVSKGDESHTVTKGNLTVVVGSVLGVTAKGGLTLAVNKGGAALTVDEGGNQVTVKDGGDTHTIKAGGRAVTVEAGDDTLTIKTGNHTIKLDAGASSTEAAQSITLKVGPSELVLKPDGITIKGLNVTIEGTTQAKISALNTQLSGSASTKIDGAVVMIN